LYPWQRGAKPMPLKRRKHKFFLRAIFRLFCRKLRNEARQYETAPGDNFPGLYWRQA